MRDRCRGRVLGQRDEFFVFKLINRTLKTFISSFAHSQDHPQEDIAMDDAGKVILVELQQVAESLGLPFHMERYSTILNQLCSEYDDECVDLGMHLQLVPFYNTIYLQYSIRDNYRTNTT